jgi:hypothetical protein
MGAWLRENAIAISTTYQMKRRPKWSKPFNLPTETPIVEEFIVSLIENQHVNWPGLGHIQNYGSIRVRQVDLNNNAK